MTTPIEINMDGKTYSGTYSLNGNLLTTRYQAQAMTDVVREIAPPVAARGMLQRLIRLSRDYEEEARTSAT